MHEPHVRCPVCHQRVELRTHRAEHGLSARLRARAQELRDLPGELLRALRAVVRREN